jgi:hypothetical protein
MVRTVLKDATRDDLATLIGDLQLRAMCPDFARALRQEDTQQQADCQTVPHGKWRFRLHVLLATRKGSRKAHAQLRAVRFAL